MLVALQVGIIQDEGAQSAMLDDGGKKEINEKTTHGANGRQIEKSAP